VLALAHNERSLLVAFVFHKLKAGSAGIRIMKEIVTWSFLREATELRHSPRSKTVKNPGGEQQALPVRDLCNEQLICPRPLVRRHDQALTELGLSCFEVFDGVRPQTAR
jgi:hypothetical protein